MSVHASPRSTPSPVKSVLAGGLAGGLARRFARELAGGFAVLATALALAGGVWPAAAREAPRTGDEAVVALAALPPPARQTHALIVAGGPFPYPHKDASVFGNRERLLPQQPRGYYREYTVRTPGVRHRGARRIVCGGYQPTSPEACFYTADHYASFARIVQ